MNCPQCEGVLVTLEFDRVEIDYCTLCGGIWLDSGELGLLLARDGHDDPLLSTFLPGHRKEKQRACPICSKGMEKALIGADGTVLLDKCTKHGLWFDKGELRKVLSEGCAGSRDETSCLVRLLDEMFVSCSGKKQVEED